MPAMTPSPMWLSPGATRERAQMYSVWTTRSVNTRNVGDSRRPGSNTTRSGFGPGTWRVVSCGSSAATVPAPTTTASHRARMRCTCTILSLPVTNCESPDGVAMNPSRLWPRWPTVTGRAEVALQIGRYRFSSSDRASSGGSRDSHPVPGAHASTASGRSVGIGRRPQCSSCPNTMTQPSRSSPSARALAAWRMLQAESTASPRCWADAATAWEDI